MRERNIGVLNAFIYYDEAMTILFEWSRFHYATIFTKVPGRYIESRYCNPGSGCYIFNVFFLKYACGYLDSKKSALLQPLPWP